MHPDWLEAFVAVADSESFVAASRVLNRAQPTVHVQVAKLAEHLDTELYRRVGRGIELTPQGLEVAAFARGSLQRNHDFEDGVRGQAQQRPVELSAGEGAFLYLLGPAIRRFRKRAEVSLRLWVGQEQALLRRVQDGRSDIAVSTQPPPSSMDSLRIAETRLLVAMPRGHALSARRALKVADLCGVDLVCAPMGRPLRDQLERAARDLGLTLSVSVEAQGWPMILHFVSLSMGVAVVNDFCRLPTGVVSRPLQGIVGPQYWALRQGDRVARPEAEVLWTALRDDCA